MPSYDYQCSSCSKEFSGVRKIADRLDIDCPECGNDKVKIVVKTATPFNYDNRMGAHKMTASFRDKLIDMKSKCGKNNTIDTH